MNPWLSRRVIGWAHQGGAAEGPANTLAAMGRALEAGIHGLEFDVHLTQDCEVVLHHDPEVVDGDEQLEIATTTLGRLRRAKPDLATLDEVLAAFPATPMTVEVKAPAAARPAVRMLGVAGDGRPVIVSSFSPAVVDDIKRQGRALDTAPAWPTVLGLWLLSRLGLPGPVGRGHVALQVSLTLADVPVARRVPLVRRLRLCDRRFVRAAHRRGLAVHVWTLDDEATMARALAAGVDGIMTDRPSALVEVLRRREAAWAGDRPVPDGS